MTAPCSLGLREIPVICTLPVLKMGQMVLYDYYSNVASEGIDGDSLPFNLDDVDACFSRVRTVKYNQTIEIESSTHHSGGLYTSICALPAGRTIGGCMWHIKHGTAEVLYAMDVNLKKELVLDGGTMDLPQSPALLITDGGGSNPSRTQANVGGGATGSRRKRTAAAVVEREESLINAVMETVRMEGNVLIPCETAGRTLEILQILGKHWTENKFTGMYHLCFLSPMGKNVLEFAKSQLEWMSESISRGFYVGKPNPFALPNLNVCSTIKEILLLGNGPKVYSSISAAHRRHRSSSCCCDRLCWSQMPLCPWDCQKNFCCDGEATRDAASSLSTNQSQVGFCHRAA
jgi:cleavage and polyadenylation specificity factor subunit 2